MAKKVNREAWLRRAYSLMRAKLLKEAPEACAISWSFPSKGAMGASRRRIGECHYQGASVGGRVEGKRVVLVSPTLQKPFEILETMLHEMVHAALPMGAGHRAPFSQLAARVGLESPWVATKAGKGLAKTLKAFLRKLPRWPGGFIKVQAQQKSRQLKAVCECEPARILRGAKATLEQGPILCGVCEGEFHLSV